jgi:hypothetical protein
VPGYSEAYGPEEIEALFTRGDGSYLFARWGRPVVPVVFGVEDASAAGDQGGLRGGGHAGRAPDGRDWTPNWGEPDGVLRPGWEELLAVPDLDRLVPGLAGLVARLEAAGANQYRIFRFDAEGAIKAAFVFLRMDAAWRRCRPRRWRWRRRCRRSFCGRTGRLTGHRRWCGWGPRPTRVILRPEIGAVIRAGYDPVLPGVARDASHALRLAARARVG